MMKQEMHYIELLQYALLNSYTPLDTPIEIRYSIMDIHIFITCITVYNSYSAPYFMDSLAYNQRCIQDFFCGVKSVWKATYGAIQ